jgi:hypothetical protein
VRFFAAFVGATFTAFLAATFFLATFRAAFSCCALAALTAAQRFLVAAIMACLPAESFRFFGASDAADFEGSADCFRD